MEFDASLSGVNDGSVVQWHIRPRRRASRSLQWSLQTCLFVMPAHSPYLDWTHYLQTASWRDSRREWVGCPHQDRTSLSAGHNGPCCLCGFPWVSVLVWRRRISAVSLLRLHSSSFRCCCDLRCGILAQCWWLKIPSGLGFGRQMCFLQRVWSEKTGSLNQADPHFLTFYMQNVFGLWKPTFFDIYIKQ